MRRLFLLLGCLVAAAVVSWVALWLIVPPDRVNREAFGRVRLGMTEAEVEEVLGRPAAEGAPGAVVMFEGVPESFVDPDSFPAGRRRQWLGREHAILVEWDERGRVSGRYFGHVNQPEGVLGRLLRLVGL
jgi:hypothetical protein